jgi:hypothetical protein
LLDAGQPDEALAVIAEDGFDGIPDAALQPYATQRCVRMT